MYMNMRKMKDLISLSIGMDQTIIYRPPDKSVYNPFLVYCRELAPGTVSLTGDRAQGEDSKHDSHYT